MNVSISDPLGAWVEARIESGRYASASDYLCDLIRQDQQRADEREKLTAALIEGEQSGVSVRQLPEIVAALKMELGHPNMKRYVLTRSADRDVEEITRGSVNRGLGSSPKVPKRIASSVRDTGDLSRAWSRRLRPETRLSAVRTRQSLHLLSTD